MTPDQIYQILLGGLGLFGGIWIRRLQSDIRDLEKPLSVSRMNISAGRIPAATMTS